jgi:universal stress protein E
MEPSRRGAYTHLPQWPLRGRIGGLYRYFAECAASAARGASLAFEAPGARVLPSIQRIVVAVKDPGAPALAAVLKATQLARALGAELELFHAIDGTVYLDMLGTNTESAQQFQSEQRRDCLQRLERVAARSRLHTPRVSVAADWDYPSYAAIVRRAIASGADLLVAEQHPGSHFAQGLLRLSDWQLLRLAPMPVLLVKNPHPYHYPRILGAVDPSHAFGKSAMLDVEILRLGALLSHALQGELHAVHAYRPPPATARALATVAGAEVIEPNVASAGIGLDGLVREAEVALAGCHLVGGDPCETVAQVARRLHAHIVIAGAVSRSGLQRAFIGNTAERLLEHLPCDLLVVKPPEFVSQVSPVRRGARQVTAEPLG